MSQIDGHAAMDRDDWNQLYVGDDADSGTGTEDLFLAVARELEPGRVLDLGCGPGALAIGLAELGWHVTGVDFADAAIASARATAAQHRVAVTFVVADITDWQPRQPFDIVVSAFALPPKGPQRDAALAAARHAAAVGGTLIVAEWDRSMATQWTFMDPNDLVSVDELVTSLDGFDVARAEVLDVNASSGPGRCAFVEARKPLP